MSHKVHFKHILLRNKKERMKWERKERRKRKKKEGTKERKVNNLSKNTYGKFSYVT